MQQKMQLLVRLYNLLLINRTSQKQCPLLYQIKQRNSLEYCPLRRLSKIDQVCFSPKFKKNLSLFDKASNFFQISVMLREKKIPIETLSLKFSNKLKPKSSNSKISLSNFLNRFQVIVCQNKTTSLILQQDQGKKIILQVGQVSQSCDFTNYSMLYTQYSIFQVEIVHKYNQNIIQNLSVSLSIPVSQPKQQQKIKKKASQQYYFDQTYQAWIQQSDQEQQQPLILLDIDRIVMKMEESVNQLQIYANQLNMEI